MQINNIDAIFSAQKATDEVIHIKRGITTGETFEKRVLALIVELGETANEWRTFKFWSEDQEPRGFRPNPSDPCEVCHAQGVFMEEESIQEFCQHCDGCGFHFHNPLLEEYVDSLHFLVSLGIDLGIEKVELREIDNDKPIERQFIELSNMASLLVFQDGSLKRIWHNLFSAFIHLGEQLGFTWNEVYEAYFEKNKVNHERQEQGY